MPAKMKVAEARELVAAHQANNEKCKMDTLDWTTYKAMNTKMAISCSDHGVYQMALRDYVHAGQRCPKCKGRTIGAAKRFPIEEVKKRLEEFASADPERYEFMDFSNATISYDSAKPTLTYVCHFVDPKTRREHGVQCSSLHDMLAAGMHKGKPRKPCICGQCRGRWISKSSSSSWEYVMAKAKQRNPSFPNIDFSKAKQVYENGNTKVVLRCLLKSDGGQEHGEWETTMAHFVHDPPQGCPTCALTTMGPDRRSIESLNTEMKQKVGDHVTLLEREGGGTHYYGLFHCSTHERYYVQGISNAVYGGCVGCRECQPLLFDNRKCRQWLEGIEKREGISIQRADHPYEFPVPGTRYRADGYHEGTKRVFEFYEDNVHGFQRLSDARFIKTKRREDEIRALGFEVIVMWEHDFDAYVADQHPDSNIEEKEDTKNDELESECSSSDGSSDEDEFVVGKKRPRSEDGDEDVAATPRKQKQRLGFDTRRKDLYGFIDACREKRDDRNEQYIVVGPYVNNRTKCLFICEEHGGFEMSPNNYKDKSQACPVCARSTCAITKSLTSAGARRYLQKVQQESGLWPSFDFHKTELERRETSQGKNEPFVSFVCNNTPACVAAGTQWCAMRCFTRSDCKHRCPYCPVVRTSRKMR